MKTVFDIGMYDGADTEYYLSEGHKVVAVEANPALVERAKAKFPNELSSGQFDLSECCGFEGFPTAGYTFHIRRRPWIQLGINGTGRFKKYHWVVLSIERYSR